MKKNQITLSLSLLFYAFFSIAFSNPSWAQLSECRAELRNDTLILENNKIKRSFIWKNGDLQSISIENKVTHSTIEGKLAADKPDLFLSGVKAEPRKGDFRVYPVASTNSSYSHLAAEIIVHFGTIEVKRIFKIYPNCPAISCDYYLRGKPADWKNFVLSGESLKNIEDENSRNEAEGKTLFTDRVAITGNHWQVKSAEFFDATDYNNNLVQEYQRLLYRHENRMRGNVLLARNTLTNTGFFILKEAPVSTIQLYYQGFDFAAKWGEVKTAGLGIAPEDLSETEWVRGYSTVVGVDQGEGEIGLLKSLRNYQSLQRTFKDDRDAMIVANTWGDRNRDSRIKEDFILKEIEAAAKMGITHLQIDDGWQVGMSSNSAYGGSLSNIWRNPGYWNVNRVKFPNGLEKVIDVAKKQNIEITLWFNPSTDSSFKNWEKDADVLIAQNKKYGIRMWKIDGVQAANKQAEINFRKFLDKITQATNYEAVFNLDVTAGRRFGFHYMHIYGNLFLENRYTDWSNYYPHFALRNLWQLSKYVPSHRIQIEFLNKWRNAVKYTSDDILAPANYSFDYLFAITMVAQPLAWFEVSNLPEEAFKTSKLISQYKLIRSDLHRGQLFPIGDEPSGFSWTGFQSMQDKKGYFIVFRENNNESKAELIIYLAKGVKVNLRLVAGTGKDFSTTVLDKGGIVFEIDSKKSFAVYEYTLR